MQNMYLVSKDVDSLIVNFFYSTDSYKHNTGLLCKIYKVFSKTNSGFVTLAKDLFFSREFKRCSVTSIEPFIGKLIRKKNIKQYDCYRTFFSSLGNDTILFTDANRKVKEIVKFLSLYHGYRCTYSNIQYSDRSGYAYYTFHNDRRGQKFTFQELRAKRVHNPKHYDISLDGLYTLKEDVVIYKAGATSERIDITCTKCI